MNKLIVAKHSKYEWERQTFGLSHDQLVLKYSKERADLQAILDSHDKQLKVREKFCKVFSHSLMVMMDRVPGDLSHYDLVMVLGGDNSFTKISHLVGEVPISGITLIPEEVMAV